MVHLGRYEILEQMGTGAMGNVYRARDEALDREVAVKTIRTGVDVDAETRQRFYREARACARLQHPNIITVFDLGEVDNNAYIAMELLEGADFRRVIQERRSMTVDAKLLAAAEVCDAIAHAHRHGVIHRDIKPSNLFLTTEGRVKVLDFGIARLPSSKLTVAGQILGTPNYMAPEQILGRPSDGRADLFSAAVVFFELLTYAHPFQGNLVPRRIAQSEPDSLFDYNADLPVILEKIIVRGLAKDPDQRYQTGDEFAADLRTVRDALRGNASAGFSGVELPSERMPAAHFLPVVPAATGPFPEGQDAQEWRLSEALRLLPEFESAMERGDVARARAALAELETRLAGDIRFMEAMRLCRTRLAEPASGVESSLPPARDQSTYSLFTATPVEPAFAEPLANAAAAGSTDLDPTFFGLSTAAVAAPQPPSPQAPAPEPPAPQAPAAQAAPVPLPNMQRKKLMIIGVGAVVCAVLLAVVFMIALRPVPVQPFVATGTIDVASANLLAAPASGAKRIASLIRGTTLNVLRLPTAGDREWVSVQVVKPKASRPGYVRVAELRDWRGETSTAAMALVRVFGSGESGSDQEINAEVQQLNDVAARFPSEPAAKEARLEIAHLKIVLGGRCQAMGKSPEECELELRAAQRELEALRDDASLQARVTELNQEIDASLVKLRPAPTQPQFVPPPPRLDIAKELEKARQFRNEGDYTAAERVARGILGANPGNKDALDLLEKIRRAQDAEKK